MNTIIFLIPFLAVVLQGLCKAEERLKRSPQENGSEQYTQDEEADEANAHINWELSQPGEFHEVDVTFELVNPGNKQGAPNEYLKKGDYNVPFSKIHIVGLNQRENGSEQYTQDEEADEANAHTNRELSQPGKFHEVEPGDVTFELVNRGNKKGVLLSRANYRKVKNTDTVISIAGWHHNTTSPKSYFVNLTNEYLKKGDYNVILVHDDKLMFYPEAVSASYVSPIAQRVANLILQLNKHSNLPFSKIHIVGHALGAHIGGLAGLYVQQQRAGQKIYRVSALEVSKVGFEDANSDERLDAKDATIVDVYHTAAGQVGLNESVGTVDFWPNGGTAPQPNCPLYPDPPAKNFDALTDAAYCSHDASIWYFIFTITRKDILGRQCSSYSNFKSGGCRNNPEAWYGDNYGGTYKGNMYLKLFCHSKDYCRSQD